jgi:hypothetical protein
MKWFPADPISHVAGDNLPGFDGALVPAPKGQKGWGIIYNNAIKSKGRINFTLAHEFGHYLTHRLRYPKGIRCVQQDIVRWDSKYRQIEQEARCFAESTASNTANVVQQSENYCLNTKDVRRTSAPAVSPA